MDGIRAYWSKSHLYTRHGTKLNSPEWFTKGLPQNCLDGELWIGRRTSSYDVLASIYSKHSNRWKEIGYYVFDLPSSPTVYEDRMNELETLKPLLPHHVHIVHCLKCQGNSHLMDYLDSITENEGEGVMVRQPQTIYSTGVTSSLLKVKVNPHPLRISHLEVRRY